MSANIGKIGRSGVKIFMEKDKEKQKGLCLEDKMDKYIEKGAYVAIVKALMLILVMDFLLKMLNLDILGQVIFMTVSMGVATWVSTKTVARKGVYNVNEYIKVGSLYLDIEEKSKGWFEDLTIVYVVSLESMYYLTGVGMYGFTKYLRGGASSNTEVFVLTYFMVIIVSGIRKSLSIQEELQNWYFKNIEFLLAQYVVNVDYEEKVEKEGVNKHEAGHFIDAYLTWYMVNYIMELDDGEWESEVEWEDKDEVRFKELTKRLVRMFEGKVRFYSEEDIVEIEGLEGEESIDKLKVRYREGRNIGLDNIQED